MLQFWILLFCVILFKCECNKKKHTLFKTFIFPIKPYFLTIPHDMKRQNNDNFNSTLKEKKEKQKQI